MKVLISSMASEADWDKALWENEKGSLGMWWERSWGIKHSKH